MKKMILIALVSLSGCAMSPREVKNYGYQFNDVSKTTPTATAGCLARNASNLPGSMFAVQQLYPGIVEVAVNETHDGLNTLSVWQISSLTYGSKLTVFVSPRIMSNPEAHFMAVKGSC